MGGRFISLISSLGLLYGLLLFHLYGVQVGQGTQYLAKAKSQYSALSVTAARRGTIYFTDRNGKTVPAATGKEYPIVYAVPKVIEDIEEAANQAALVLGVMPEDLVKVFSKKSATYVMLQKKASADLAGKVQDLNLKGFYVEDVPMRFYPFGSLAAHVIGFVGPNASDNGESGKYGLEKLYDESLKGVVGKIDGNKIVPSQAGEDITLTIDPTVQKEAEHILRGVVNDYHAKGGGVIIMDPKTGRILAMAATPVFDPNKYSESSIGTFLNPLVEEIYEPGSVFKVLTMAAGIDSGAVTPETVFYDSGKLVLNGKTIRNWDLKAHGNVTMTNVIEKSLNTGAAFVARKMGGATFAGYLKKFGLGERTGIDLPGELAGNLSRLGVKAADINFATAAFGQGVAVTPLHVINAIGAIANGGKLMRPYINAKLGPKVVREVITPEAAEAVAKMMVSAVDKAEIAHVDGFTIAGKTGTAQVPNLVKGGYYDDRVNNTYVGFGPTKDPKFIILIKLNEPQGSPVAGLTVVPAFRNLAQFVLNYYNIAPDRVEK
ncbi:MAG: penicillin-binding protein 2 [Patescibacteria group bacterium]